MSPKTIKTCCQLFPLPIGLHRVYLIDPTFRQYN